MLLAFSKLGAIEDIGRGVRWDAAMFAREVERRFAALASMDIRRGAFVAIGHNAGPAFFADLMSVWSTGAAAAVLDSSLTATEIETLVRFVRPAAFLTGESGATPSLPVATLDLTRAHDAGPAATVVAPDPDAPALVLFTSGTTGTPKGVVLSFRALTARIALNEAAIGRRALARTLVTLPTHFGHGLIGNALTPLMNGCDIVLPPAGMLLAKELGRIIDGCGITFLSSVPALWPMAMKFSAEAKHPSLERVHIGSAPLSPTLWSEVAAWTGADVVNCYGMTETANWVSGASFRKDGVADGAVGRMWGGAAAVLDDEHRIRPTGTGELLVQTPSLMSGYLHRPDLTASVMHDGWYRTGDRGVVSDDGHIRLVGRVKDEINRAGFKIQPAELDALLGGHPEVAEACVFAISDPVAGELVAAAVAFTPGARATSEDLRAWCRERLRREAVPERWFVVDAIPRNARGKVGRDAVRQSVMKGVVHGDAAGRSAD